VACRLWPPLDALGASGNSYFCINDILTGTAGGRCFVQRLEDILEQGVE
jgi:hypothetical protein